MLILCLLAVLLVVIAFCYYQIEGFAIAFSPTVTSGGAKVAALAGEAGTQLSSGGAKVGAQNADGSQSSSATAVAAATPEQIAAAKAAAAAAAKAAQAAAALAAQQSAQQAAATTAQQAAQQAAATGQQAATTAAQQAAQQAATTAPANGGSIHTGTAAANPALLRKSNRSTPAPLMAAPLTRSQYTASMATPMRTDIIPQVTVSDTGYTAMELANKANFLQDIQRIVRQEIMSNRTSSENHPMNMQSNDSCSNSHANSQGTEYRNTKQTDMSKYIKKDSIPCWNCDLDY